ncbi:DUF6286 domain-containing protein [Ruania alba]|uniref:DUF6286 domain-containing protein n=1 Tax=Ruania alba TaxID=648782 RepID=A0A1H5LTT3_9MICO|nr:DUF6286 domain-containing protein [Ruania alba]SEE80525.1 hypothetical protein SAMN04488554_2981 [Ruania alba]
MTDATLNPDRSGTPAPGVPSTTGGYSPLPPARQPRTRAGVRVVTAVGALVLAAAATVLAQHALVAWNLVGGQSWLLWVLELIEEQGSDGGVQLTFGAVCVAAALLILIAVSPRRRTGYRLSATPALYLNGHDVARLSSTAAQTVDGVLDARTTVTGRRLRVDVTATGQHGIASEVELAARKQLSLVGGAFRVKAQVRTPNSTSAVGMATNETAPTSSTDSTGGTR